MSKDDDFCAFHVHSDFSVGDSIIGIEKLVRKCHENNIKSCTLTDHGNLCGMMKFHDACRKYGIKPISGCELYVQNPEWNWKEEKSKKKDEDDHYKSGSKKRKNFHLILIAKNKQGLVELQKIVGSAYRHNFYRRPMTTNRMILKYARNGNLICSTACIGSQFGQLALEGKFDQLNNLLIKFEEAFKDDFFVELQINNLEEQKFVNEVLIESASKIIGSDSFIYGMDAHYLNAEDYNAREAVKCIRYKKSFFDDDYYKSEVVDLNLKALEEVWQSYEKYGNYLSPHILECAINNASKVSSRCENYDIKNSTWSIPEYIVDGEKKRGKEAQRIFYEKVMKGFKKLIEEERIEKSKIDKYILRLKHEINVIVNKGFENYFLVTVDAIDYVRSIKGYVGPGRGSGSSSLVAWSLGLTDIDPIKHGLIFERFLSPQRKDCVDLDIDISSEERDKIDEYLRSKYGEDAVCHVATYSTYGPKTLIRDIARIMKWDYKFAHEIGNAFELTEKFEEGYERITSHKLVSKEAIDFFKKHYDSYSYYMDRLTDLVRNMGKHAAGCVVVPSDSFEEYAPVHRLKDEILASYTEGADSRELSDCGLVKFDFLGLTNCSVIREALQYINKNVDKKVTIPCEYNDPKVYDTVFLNADTDLIFQFSSSNMKRLMKEAEPKNIQELANINALYRPAVIKAGGIKEYFDGKSIIDEGGEIDYIHHSMKDILNESFSAWLYQEQLMQITRKVAGFTFAEAEDFRKTIKLYKLLDEERDSEDASVAAHRKKFNNTMDHFFNGAQEFGGLSKEKAQGLLETLKKYSTYLFNKSHSLSYSVIAYQMAWLQTYFPVEFFTAVLKYTKNEDNKMIDVVRYVKNHGVNVKFPGINKSKEDFSIQDGKIVFGFKFIKGIGDKPAAKIVQMQPFENAVDLVYRFVKKKINKKAAEGILMTGVCDELHDNRKQLYDVWAEARTKKFKENEKLVRFIANKLESSAEDFNEAERFSIEKKFFNFYLKEHPFTKFKKYIRGLYAFPPSEVPEHEDYVKVGGIINEINHRRTKNKKPYVVIGVEDTKSKIMFKGWSNFVSFLEKQRFQLKEGDLIVANLKRDKFGYTVNSKNLYSKDLDRASFINLSAALEV